MIGLGNVVILASGGGSNAEKIVRFLHSKSTYKVSRIYTNKPSAGVLSRAKELQVQGDYLKPSQIYDHIIDQKEDVQLIVLAGFLRKIPSRLIKTGIPIVNIHPSLLPKYGGKGMYGQNVHRAVFESGEQYSGMTIHLVNEEYDKGKILFQAEVDISNCQSADEVGELVLQLEHQYYPRVILQFLEGLNPPV